MTRPSIGERIKKLREERGLSVTELAERAGVDPGMAEDLENASDGQAPALGYLVKFSRALGARLGALMDDVECDGPCIVRAAAIHEQARRAGDCHVQTYHSLGRGKPDRHMEPFYITLGPCETERPALSSHEGEEFIVVHSGRARLRYGNETHVLEPGDSMYYNSITPHRVAAADNEPASIYAVLFIPF